MTLGSHQRTIGTSQVHITPLRIITATGPYDLDPCAASPRPWDCATENFTVADNGLALAWFGRVWLNPPFHRYQVGTWIARLVGHGRGTALLHARTETGWFRPIWENAAAILFLAGRIIFHKPDGSLQTTAKGEVANSGAPPVLVAFGWNDADILACCGLAGAFVPLRLPRSVVAVAILPSWSEALGDWLTEQSGPVALADIYRAFAVHPKTRGRAHWREKVRQTLKRGGFPRVGRGLYAARRAA
jgi:hypothetical protein